MWEHYMLDNPKARRSAAHDPDYESSENESYHDPDFDKDWDDLDQPANEAPQADSGYEVPPVEEKWEEVE